MVFLNPKDPESKTEKGVPANMFNIGEKIVWKQENYTGTIKWISPGGIIVGVDFDQEIDEFAPGWEPYSADFFEFRQGHGRILPASELVLKDSYMQEETPTKPTMKALQTKNVTKELNNNDYFSYSAVTKIGRKGKRYFQALANHFSTEKAEEHVEEFLKILTKPSKKYDYLAGGRAVEWQSNSCYLDSTLFALFYANDAFDDTILSTYGTKEPQSETSKNIQHILKYEVVYHLRRFLKCPGRNTAKLRTALSQFNKKLIGSFMDAEDLLFILLDQALGLREFIQYTNGGEDFLLQIFVEPSQMRRIETVHALLKKSLLSMDDNLKFNGIPNPALIIEMPRSNGRLIGCKAVVPNLTLNLTEMMSSVDCNCGKPATWGCPDCFKISDELGRINNRWTTFCDHGAEAHREIMRNHKLLPISEFNESHPALLDLVSVICVRDAHYVAFTKCGKEPLSPWLFSNSFNNVEPVQDMGTWLQKLENAVGDQFAAESLLKNSPDRVRRILMDSHICIYSKK